MAQQHYPWGWNLGKDRSGQRRRFLQNVFPGDSSICVYVSMEHLQYTSFLMQIANRDKPNSAKKTCVFCCFKAGDSTANLHLALATYKDQVTRLQSGTTWRYRNLKHYKCVVALNHSLLLSTCRGKRIRVFLFGDYEFLCRIVGISGPTGKYYCYL